MLNRYTVSALVGLAVLAGCQKTEEAAVETPQEELAAKEWTLTVEATRGEDTKALELINAGSTLNAYWNAGEKVAVFFDGAHLGDLTATPAAEKSQNATLSATLTSVAGLAVDSELNLLFPGRADHKWDYTGQDGSEPSESGTLATQYDYALATVEVASLEGNNISTKSEANFRHQQSVYRFNFKVGETPLEVKGFNVAAASNKLVQSRNYSGGAWVSTYGPLDITPVAATSDLLYVSLRNETVGTSSEDTYSFSVTGSDNALYLGSKAIPAAALDHQSRYITARGISVTKVETPTPDGVIDLPEKIW